MTFVKFRIWTGPMEQVNNFYIYFDQLKVLTDTFETRYDGEELADPKKVQELWSGGDNN
ncbi:MAG: flagellar filament outer layer protein FlaA [Treponema sp.]|nr:flagellar filament outer layer protein FlaA [Treponema sp.]